MRSTLDVPLCHGLDIMKETENKLLAQRLLEEVVVAVQSGSRRDGGSYRWRCASPSFRFGWLVYCLKGAGFKSNYYDLDTGQDYWISGPKRAGGDALYGGNIPIEIDKTVRDE